MKIVHADRVYVYQRGHGIYAPGMTLDLRRAEIIDEGLQPLGALWIWERSSKDLEVYVMQSSHEQHVHRVVAVTWHVTTARLLRDLLDTGMRMGDVGVYTMLREAGLAPVVWPGQLTPAVRVVTKRPGRKQRRK